MKRSDQILNKAGDLQILKGRKIVVVGFGAQGKSQALNLRDSGLDVSVALKESSIARESKSFLSAKEEGFRVGSIKELAGEAFLVINLAPDREHKQSTQELMKYMQKGSFIGFSHGFSMSVGLDIRDDIEPVLCAPKGPGNELRSAFLESRGLPAIVSGSQVGLEVAVSWARGIGSHRSVVLISSFKEETISDLYGEQVVLCGLLQASIMALQNKLDAQVLRNGFKILTSTSTPARLGAIVSGHESFIHKYEGELRALLEPIYQLHIDGILNGAFYEAVLQNWESGDELLRAKREKYSIKPSEVQSAQIRDVAQNQLAILALILKVGVELCFEKLVAAGIDSKSAYIESLYELPLLANLISLGDLDYMNSVISDTAEFGNYLFCDHALSALTRFFDSLDLACLDASRGDVIDYEFKVDEGADLFK